MYSDARGSTQVLAPAPPHCKTGWAIKMIKMIKHRLLRTPAGSRISRPPRRNAMSIAAISAYPDKPNMGQAEAVNMWRRPFPARASQDRRRPRPRRQRIGRYWCTRITSALPQYGPSKNHPTVFTCGCSSSRLSQRRDIDGQGSRHCNAISASTQLSCSAK